MESGLKFKWTLVSWDFPMDTQAARRAARAVNLAIKKFGGRNMIWGNCRKGAALIVGDSDRAMEIVGPCPQDGRVDYLGITDKQFERQKIVWGDVRKMESRS